MLGTSHNFGDAKKYVGQKGGAANTPENTVRAYTIGELIRQTIGCYGELCMTHLFQVIT